MEASVQYGDYKGSSVAGLIQDWSHDNINEIILKGTAAADENLNLLHQKIEYLFNNTEYERYICTGIELSWVNPLESGGYFDVLYCCVERREEKTSEPTKLSMGKLTPSEFFSMFKRFEVVLKSDKCLPVDVLGFYENTDESTEDSCAIGLKLRWDMFFVDEPVKVYALYENDEYENDELIEDPRENFKTIEQFLGIFQWLKVSLKPR